MTKSLTQLWKDGELPNGKYYIKLEPNFAERYDIGYNEEGDFALYNIEDIEEVLAPVPSYDHFSQLVKKVENLEWNKKEDDLLIDFCNKRLVKYHKEIAKLQEQLKEANAIIDLYFPKDKKINAVCVKPINDYREKWGVK